MMPLVSEQEWSEFLNQFSEWQPPQVKTFILTPHPDDETLGVGGIIFDLVRRGIDVTLIAVTDGENAYADFPHLRSVRIAEQNLALSMLGLPTHKIIRLALIDSGISAARELLQEQLENLIVGPCSIFATWDKDFHPDHEAVGEIALNIARKTQSYLNYYFFWTWHRGTLATLAGLPLSLYPLNHEAYLTKQLAIQVYQSQLNNFAGESILNDLLLLPTKRKYEVILPYAL